ncbi:amidohydrolase [Flavobacteriaceae bacterium F89]|uniref:Omega-amidase YafV n=1 Tax=Cerina litoralis TaxID=2874477 RepID=A0AAE3JNU8_9FLAO|nr:amidohydrolase [Cerina litoralis]MCG2460139.1 amidohydrolase [Cerina litoralis]
MPNKLEIALIQVPLFWEDPERNRELFSRKMESISNKTDIIVLPEMFTTGFTMAPENLDPREGEITVAWMQEKAKEYNAAVVGSIVIFEGGRYFNRLFFVKPDGRAFHYDKRHTFTLAGEDKVYQAGTEKLNVDFRGFKICPLICYDLRFPVWARNSSECDVLIYVANWPTPRIMAWDTLLKARAIENMVYCIGVNRIGQDKTGHDYPGHSAVCDTLGERLAFSQVEEIVVATLNKDHIVETRKKLGFLEDRDAFILK